MNYYNEYDPNAAEWLRQLIGTGAIPKGEVDERSIADVTAGELRGYTQCHFFAGIGGWSLALERAGIPAARPLWTGSCPCQDFSCAGKGEGVAGARDLWPVFFRLIRECRPVRVFGEQVAAAIGHGWLDRLSADLEAEGYAVGAAVLGAHSAGADHQRQRLYWLAHSEHDGQCGATGNAAQPRRNEQNQRIPDGDCAHVGLADAEHDGGRPNEPRRSAEGRAADGRNYQVGFVAHAEGSDRRSELEAGAERCGGRGLAGNCGADGLADTETGGFRADGSAQRKTGHAAQRDTTVGLVLAGEQGLQGHAWNGDNRHQPGRIGALASGHAAETGAHGRNFWSGATTIPCRDNCVRRAEPGIFPLVAKLPRGMVYGGDPGLPEYANDTAEARVMRLKGYGNAITVETARMFIEAAEAVNREHPDR